MHALGLANLHFTNGGEPSLADCAAALARGQGRVNHAAPSAALTLPTRPPSTAGWFAVDTHTVQVGRGVADFEAAADAVGAWAHADALPWVGVTTASGGSGTPTRRHRRHRPPPSPAPGDGVVIAARATGPLNLGRWASPWLANPLVVVGVRRGGGGGGRWRTRGGPAAAGEAAALPSSPLLTRSRYDVALATTASHVLAGGERFSVTRRADDDTVWFEATAFARPASVAAAVGWPVVRALQAAFRRGAGEAVRVAVVGGQAGRRRAGRRWEGLW